IAASASWTGMPSAANSLAVSLLPMPMPPVSPIAKGLGIERPLQMLAQSAGDLGPHAKESFKRRHRLVHQHAKPIDGDIAARLGICQQRCFQWIVNDIHH